MGIDFFSLIRLMSSRAVATRSQGTASNYQRVSGIRGLSCLREACPLGSAVKSWRLTADGGKVGDDCSVSQGLHGGSAPSPGSLCTLPLQFPAPGVAARRDLVESRACAPKKLRFAQFRALRCRKDSA